MGSNFSVLLMPLVSFHLYVEGGVSINLSQRKQIKKSGFGKHTN